MLRAAAVSELKEPRGFDGRAKIIKKKMEKSQGKKYIEENLLEQMDKLLEQV